MSAAAGSESLAASGAAPLGATRGKGTGEFIKVVVRARPLNDKEISEGQEKILELDAGRGVAVLQKRGGLEKEFAFDTVLDEHMTQQQVFDETAIEILDSVVDGFNGTIFAYGPTGAGKTYTMTGPEGCTVTEDRQGLLPRAFRYIFAIIDATSESIKYLVRGSYIEIYNEEVRDLLSSTPRQRCELKEDPATGVSVKDLSAFVVQSTEDMQNALDLGLKNRSLNKTQMNESSSRSHSMFMITVEQCCSENNIRVGKLNMVDLAGSERQSSTGAAGDRLKEAFSINLSLSALGNVISALVDGKSSHIPYRDSKLTRLLQDSLGGNTKTVMVANCLPGSLNFEDTLSTLRYAYRAKGIQNKPMINSDPKEAMIREFQDQIMRLKAELEGAGGAATDDLPPFDGSLAAAPAALAAAAPSPSRAAAAQVATRTDREGQRSEELEESERQKLLQDISEEQKVAIREKYRKSQLEQNLRAMEDKIVQGKSIMAKAMHQEQTLKKKQRELKKHERLEKKLKQQEEQQRIMNEELEEKCASQEEHVQKLTSRLHKLWDKHQRAQQEMVDVQQFNQGEREDMLAMIRELRQTLKLKTLIMESFMPPDEVQNLQERAIWDAENDEWQLAPARSNKENLPLRPLSATGHVRPTSDFAARNFAAEGSGSRFKFDSIMAMEPELPERSTEDYDHDPFLSEPVERFLVLALAPDDADDDARREGKGSSRGEDRQRRSVAGASAGFERPSTGHRFKRPGNDFPDEGRDRMPDLPGGMLRPPAVDFPQARGLVSRE